MSPAAHAASTRPATGPALAAGGGTIMVLAEALQQFSLPRFLINDWDYKRGLVVSEWEPGTAWQSNHALARNETILQLSLAVIVVELAVRSGTMNTVRRAIRMGMPLYICCYKDQPAGNDEALRLGGKPLRAHPWGVPNLTNVLTHVEPVLAG